MPNVDIKKIVTPDGTVCNLRDSQCPDVNEAIEAILDGGGGSEIFAHLYVSIDSGAIVTATSPAATYTATSGSGDEAFIEIGKSGTYTITATKSGVSSSSATVAILESGGVYNETINFIRLTINVPSGSDYTITDGTTTITGTSSGGDIFNYLPNTGSWTVSCTDGTNNASETITISSYTDYLVTLDYGHIYGVLWDKSSATTLTRTDDAVGFSDPNPYYSGMSGTPSSPFDNIMPWAGMVQETIDGNVLVRIPKFWYKITNNSNAMTIQIADKPTDGFLVSPAHQARNADDSDRYYVYIGRYKCIEDSNNNSNTYKSQTGKLPKVLITKATVRSAIANLGAGFYQQDFAMWWTIRILYIVEFANWNSQDVIGYGCGNDVGSFTGRTDSMPYHTGTMASSRSTHQNGIQYRYIEDLWDNVYEFIDGIYFSGTNKVDIYVIKDPDHFDSTSYATKVGTRDTRTSNPCIKDFTIPSNTGLEWALFPSADQTISNIYYNTYICDQCRYSNSGNILFSGSNSTENPYFGMFYLDGAYNTTCSTEENGARLMYLPPNS